MPKKYAIKIGGAGLFLRVGWGKSVTFERQGSVVAEPQRGFVYWQGGFCYFGLRRKKPPGPAAVLHQ